MKAPTKFATAAAAAVILLVTATSAQAVTMVFDALDAFSAAVSNIAIEDFEGAPWEPADDIKWQQPVEDQGLAWYASSYLLTTRIADNQSLLITDLDPIFGGTDHSDLLWAVLPSGVNAIGVFISTNGQQNQGVQIRALDAADNVLLDAVTPATTAGEFSFIGVVSLFDIRKVEFASLSAPPNDDFFLDNFYYGKWSFALNATSSSVAEPATPVLLGATLVVLGLAACRRQSRAA